MREYEFVYIIQPDATPEREAEIHGRLDRIIEAAGSQVLLRDDWGKRKLAYEIQDFQKGHYIQLNFLGSGTEIQELERAMRIDQDVLRFLTILAEDEVKDVETRAEEARVQAEEQAQRREERARQEAERERERARISAESSQPQRLRADKDDEESRDSDEEDRAPVSEES